MESEVGRYLEGRLHDTQQLLRTIYDLGLGQGKDTCIWIDGREMIFGRGGEGRGRGFLRIIPGEVAVILAFPRGHELFDPKKMTKGPMGSQTSMSITHASQLDMYVRRLIECAYALDN